MTRATNLILTALTLIAALVSGPACATEVINHSFARVDEAATTHIDLDIVVDFDREEIRGKASLQIVNKSGTDKLYLDTRGLRIHRVTLSEAEKPTAFALGDEQGYLGRPLIVGIEPATKIVNVYYETAGGVDAADWLKPSQTADGTMPFLFTQGQAILNRTWIPCQDNPGVRVTYHARVHVPAGMMAVMSASNPIRKSPDGVYEFDMPQPIPPYLIALAAGDLEFRSLGDRSGVYAEPSVVDRAAWEFADTESMIASAEALYGPYRWERFDMIVLPPSFPFGGMENPRLTFLTPVLLAGDRSLVSTVAHELAHSWSGNLVTNATWDDFWLNEGFTTYFERRIMEVVYGNDAMEMDALLGFTDMQQTIERKGADHPDTRLHNDTASRDPDEGISAVAYEKGYLFLRLLEETVGRDRWDPFLRKYFDTFAFQTMTTDKFIAYLSENLIESAQDKALRIDEWVNEPGLPDNYPRVHSVAFEHVAGAVERWTSGADANSLGTDGWSSQQWKEFLQKLPMPQSVERLRELDEAFSFTEKANAEVMQVWFLHALAGEYEPAYPAMEAYLKKIGRIWLIGPIYRKMAETPEGLAAARRIFETARTGYHPIAVGYIERLLDGQG